MHLLYGRGHWGDTGSETTCYCSIEEITDILSKKYGLQIIALLDAESQMRHGEIKEQLDVSSDATFSNRFKDLVDEGILERHRSDEIPPRVEYSLTDRGRDLKEQLQPLREWTAKA